MSRVWDPGQLGCVKSNWFKVLSIVDKCNALTCPLIAYSLVFTEYYVVQHPANISVASSLYHCSRWHGTGVGGKSVKEIIQGEGFVLCLLHTLWDYTTIAQYFEVANEVASLLLTNLTIRGDDHAYSNLEDKVLIGVGNIVMNGPRPILAKRPNTELSGYVWDPC
ncbi:hypothetical protein KY290_013676 [Solanum tuberosum]|uniref:Uncharacterized protein n=1 Tax=Solanum tuberosum TaxID=4113 RepID=A0ABQ7VPH0_SOLTU|nr:hypothetical protein KY290_013676 [Solanum tuberosum]